MKKLIFMGILGLFILGSCNSKSGGNHEGHDHGTEAHDHEHEGHDHEHEGEDHEGHDHEGDEHSRLPVTVTKSFCRKPKQKQPE